MNVLYSWAARHGIPLAALKELEVEYGLQGQSTALETPASGTKEAAVQWAVRLEAARVGVTMWRNNVGALKDERGVPVRYGLANDTPALNKRIKSGDLIGVRPVVITPAMVGSKLGQFVSRECKAPGWSYGHTEREQAQLRWVELINSLGGDAAFVNGAGSFVR